MNVGWIGLLGRCIGRPFCQKETKEEMKKRV